MPALAQLVAQLPAAVLVVQHLAPDNDPEALVMRLAARTALRCQVAGHGAPLLAGHLYLAPPDRHLLVKEDRVLVTKGPFENGYRPSADALFRAAAVAFDSHVVGVVLTGMLHDGTAGLEFIKRCGGTAVVQDPAEAEFSSMPESALRNPTALSATPSASTTSSATSTACASSCSTSTRAKPPPRIRAPGPGALLHQLGHVVQDGITGGSKSM